MLFNPHALRSSFIYLIFSAGFAMFLTENAQGTLSLLESWFYSINSVIFLIMAKDKLSAKLNISRVPEGTLLWLGFFGGFPGLFLGRFIFRHKTTKREFILPMRILFFIQILIVIYYLVKIDPAFSF